MKLRDAIERATGRSLWFALSELAFPVEAACFDAGMTDLARRPFFRGPRDQAAALVEEEMEGNDESASHD
jgi:hypothetical protein